jgi:protein transport protein SEC23
MDLMDMGIGLDAIRRENEQGPLIPLRHDKHAGRDAAMKARGGAAPAHSSASNAVAGSELYDTLSSADFSQEVRVDAVKTGIANRLARISASAFPADAIVANCGALPIGAILSLFAPAPAPADADADADAANDDAVPTLRRDPASCYHCGAFASASCRVDLTLGAWRCALCDVGNVDALYACGGGGSNGGRDAFPELTNAVVEYHLESGSGDGSAGGGGGGDGEGGGNGGVVFFVVDDALDDDEAALLRASLSRVASGLDASQSVGFVTYAASVAVYELGGASAVASAEVLSGAKSPRAADLDAFLGKEEEDDDDGGGDGGGSIGRFIAPARACRAALEAVISSIKPAGRSTGPVAGRARCAGVAIETAAAMIRRRGGPGRILVCAGGPCTRGPGGVRADDESELFDFERATAAAYVDELSSTVREVSIHATPADALSRDLIFVIVSPNPRVSRFCSVMFLQLNLC